MRRRLIQIVGVLAVLTLVATGCSKTAEEKPGLTIRKGILAVGSCLDFPPFESVKAGEVVGFDIDLTTAIAKKLGLEVQWVQTDFATSFTAVAANQFDMIAAAVTATGELGTKRAQTVDFSDFYFNSRQSLAVNADNTPDITSTDDLKSGTVVGVQKGTTGEAWAKENLAPKGVAIKSYDLITPAFADLEAGNLTGIVNDQPSSAAIVKDLPGLKVVEAIETNEKYAFAFSPTNPTLRQAVDNALKGLIADGTWATIYHKWFPTGEVPPEFVPSQ